MKTRFTLLLACIIMMSQAKAGNFSILGNAASSGQILGSAIDTSNNLLYLAGNLTNVDGLSAPGHIAVWNGVNWDTLGAGLNGPVADIIMYKGDLYAVGLFTVAGTDSVHRIARWDGTNWFDVGNGFNGYANGLVIYDNKLFVYGNFGLVGGTGPLFTGGLNVQDVVAWDGTAWSDPAALGNLDMDIATVYNNKLIVASEYGMEQYDGTTWTTIASPPAGETNSFYEHNGKLLVGKMNTSGIGSIWEYDGTTFTLFKDSFNAGSNNRILSMIEFGGALYVAGKFDNVGTTEVNNIVKFDGTDWLALGAGYNGEWDGTFVMTEYANSLVVCNISYDMTDTTLIGSIGVLGTGVAPTAPLAPSNLSVSANKMATKSIDLDWDDNSDNEVGFVIERSLTGTGAWTTVDSIGADLITYTDTGLAESTTYHYQVYAYNGVGASSYSNTANATTGGSGSVGIDAATNIVRINFYPNPSNGHIQLTGYDQDSKSTLTIYDLLGSKVHQSILEHPNIDLSALNNGVYILNVTSLDQSISRKLILEK